MSRARSETATSSCPWGSGRGYDASGNRGRCWQPVRHGPPSRRTQTQFDLLRAFTGCDVDLRALGAGTWELRVPSA